MIDHFKTILDFMCKNDNIFIIEGKMNIKKLAYLFSFASIKTRVNTMVMVLIVGLLFLSIFANLNINKIAEQADTLNTINHKGLQLISDLRITTAEQEHLFQTNQGGNENEFAKKGAYIEALAAEIADYLELPEHQEDFAKYKQTQNEYTKAGSAFLQRRATGEVEQNLPAEVKASKIQRDEALSKIISDFDELGEEKINEIKAIPHLFLIENIASTSFLVIFIGGLSLFIASLVSSQIVESSKLMGRIAKGNLNEEVMHTEFKDEIGVIAQSIDFFRKELLKTEELKSEQEAFREKSLRDQRKSLNNMASQIEENLETSSNDVNNYAINVIKSANKLSDSSSTVNNYVAEVNDLGETSLMDIQSVSAAVEELSVSNNEIVGQLNKVNEVIMQTVTNNTQTQETVSELVESIESINKFTTFISDIAKNTNLLALNATIESARAGEAGKGFGVVANEVKGLASQTAKLTEEISSQLQALTDKMSNAQNATNAIGESINEINSLSTEITQSIGAQSEATAEIASRIVNTTDATRSIVQKIGNVKNEANITTESSEEIIGVIAEMQNKIKNMKTSLNKTLRTASPEVNRRKDERFTTNASCHICQGDKSFDAKLIDITTKGVGVEVPEGYEIQKDHTTKIEISGYSGQLSAQCVECKDGRASLVIDFPDEKRKELFEDFVIDLAQKASTKQPELKAA
jgi:methyl-accepting chemotaxis protein